MTEAVIGQKNKLDRLAELMAATTHDFSAAAPGCELFERTGVDGMYLDKRHCKVLAAEWLEYVKG